MSVDLAHHEIFLAKVVMGGKNCFAGDFKYNHYILKILIIYNVMNEGKYCLNTMHIFHRRENIKTCIFTAVKIKYFIFSQERNRKIGTTFFYFLNMVYGKQTCFFSKGNDYGISYFYGNVNKKSESLRSLIKKRAFINSYASTRKSKHKLM